MTEKDAAVVLNWILETLEERCSEADRAMSESKSDAFIAGRALAYTEALEIVKNRVDILKTLE